MVKVIEQTAAEPEVPSTEDVPAVEEVASAPVRRKYVLRRRYWDGNELHEAGAVLRFVEGLQPSTADLYEEPISEDDYSRVSGLLWVGRKHNAKGQEDDMADLLTVWNMAISAAGGRGNIASPTERSREADLCRLWYPQVRDAVLRTAPWPSATAYARLAVVEEAANSREWAGGKVPPSWRFAYAAPADMINPRHLHSFRRFQQTTFGDERLIITNEENAILHYTKLQDKTELWDSGLTHAMVYYLAAAMVRDLSGKTTDRERLRQEAFEVVMLARTDEANASDENFEALPSWIAARGFQQIPTGSRFFFPYEDVNIGAAI